MSIAALLDNPTLRGNSTAKSWLRQKVADGTPLRPGMLPLTVAEAELPDGSVGPWREDFCWSGVASEVTALRDACAIVLIGLTGMRSSEALAIPREGWRTTWWGYPAIRSHLIKTAAGEPRKWWATDVVIRACELLEVTSPPDADTLLSSRIAERFPTGPAPESGEASSDVEHAQEAADKEFTRLADVALSTSLARFVVSINESQTLRYSHPIPAAATWGKRATKQGDKLNPHAFRHTLAAIGNTAVLGDVALYTQFQHATHAVTWTYMQNDSKNAWTDLLVNRQAVEGLEATLEMAAGPWSGEEDLAGPAGRKLQNMMLDAFDNAGVPDYDPDSPDLPVEQLAAAIVGNATLAALLRSIASEIHLGVVNHCRFDPMKAMCTTAESSLPVLAACVPEQCGNVIATGTQTELFVDLLEETKSHLKLKNIPKSQRQLFEARRANLERVVGQEGEPDGA